MAEAQYARTDWAADLDRARDTACKNGKHTEAGSLKKVVFMLADMLMDEVGSYEPIEVERKPRYAAPEDRFGRRHPRYIGDFILRHTTSHYLLLGESDKACPQLGLTHSFV